MSGSLRSLSDHEIHSRIRALIDEERALTLNVLLHLNEIERRKLHFKGGYPSMFIYCTRSLGYSASAAVRRIRTARAIAQYPEIFALLQTNEVNLSTISQVANILKPENRSAILSRIRGKSQSDVQAIAAEYEPRLALPPDRVRTVVVATATPSRTDSHFSGLFEPHTNEYNRSGGRKSSSVEQSTHENGHAGAHEQSSAATVIGTAAFERHAVVEFSAREVVINKLERVRSIASHRLPANAPLEQVIEFLADYFNEREDPAQRHARREERKQNEKSEPVRETVRLAHESKTVRRMPSRVRDHVFSRDKGQCTHVGPGGKQCCSTHVLQVDHVKPVARGGASTLDNLRLLCAYHNRLEVERLMGRVGPPAPASRRGSVPTLVENSLAHPSGVL